MKTVPIGESPCQRARRYLDAYLSNELLVETTQEVLRHVENCAECAAELEVRSRLKRSVRQAVRNAPAPPELAALVRERIGKHEARGQWAGPRMRWAAAAAACVAVAVSTWMYRENRLPETADRAGQNAYIERVSHTLASVLRVGLGDHIHCSVFRKYPKNPPPVESMQSDLGEQWKGILQAVNGRIPDGFRVIMAHRCGYAGRRYVHLTLEKDGRLASLVIAKKQPGETLAGLRQSARTGGIPIYQSSSHRYEVAGFETPDYLAFVVSDLGGASNLRIASAMAPSVEEFLRRVGA